MIKGLGNLGDMAKMMSKAQELQGKVAEAQERVEQLEAEGEAGGGLVKARVSGKGELKGVEIDPSLFVPEDKEAVEDLIVAAIKTAQERAQEAAREEMAKVTEGLGLPPGMNLPF